MLHLATWHSPVFLLNSCLDLFSAPRSPEDPLSRSYRVILPSSLTVNHPSASVCSTRPRVSVYGTDGDMFECLADFLGSMVTSAIAGARRPPRTIGTRLAARTCLRRSSPTPFNRLFRQTAAVSLLRPRVTHVSSNGILTVLPSASPEGLSLGPDLPGDD